MNIFANLQKIPRPTKHPELNMNNITIEMRKDTANVINVVSVTLITFAVL